VQWNGLPVASLVVFAVGGLMYAGMYISTTSPSTTRAPATRRPGRVARRRARGGIRPTKPGAAIGYGSATHQVGLSPRELTLGGLILGALGSGKTYAAAVLIEALAWQDSAFVHMDMAASDPLCALLGEVISEIARDPYGEMPADDLNSFDFHWS
jgi:hypothetical protein